MKILVRTLLILGLGGGFACTPDDMEPTYAEPDVQYRTERGYYAVEVGPAEGRRWPRVTGPTAFKIHVEPHVDPSQYELGTGPAVQPPFTLSAGPARLRGDEPAATEVEPSRVTPDGSEWTVTLDFTAPGAWSLPLRITDVGNRQDELELVFRIGSGRK